MSDLFQSTTIPLLEQVVNFSQARHTVLAGNIANSSTPGYVAHDLSVADFQAKLKKAVAAKDAPSETFTGAWESGDATPMAKVSKNPPGILFHDQSQVGLESQASEMVKNRLQHNLAITIMANQFQLLHSAISEQV
jgi:flagellar basal-body rod protein FlgB